MLKKLTIQNFTCFPNADLQFSKGLNVIVGENGTGKSHILKLGYTVLRALSWPDASFAKEVFARDFARHLVSVFKSDNLGRLPSRVHGQSKCHLDVTINGRAKGAKEPTGFACNFSPRNTDLVNIELLNVEPVIQKPLFIPAKEILSVFSGFQHALENRELQFDATYLDLAKALAANSLRESRLTSIARYLNPLEDILGGHVDLEEGAFYFYDTQAKPVKKRLEAQLMAEGHRKLGMLMHLLKTGGLTTSSSLFWDEPEANLNPKLIKKLAAVLVELSEIMQITVATHSLFLLRELEIYTAGKKLSNARYFGLHPTENGVEVLSGDSSDDIGDIAVLDASVAQSEEYMNLQYGN
jgi:predicted ATPase